MNPLTPYAPPAAAAPIDLRLHNNEGPPPPIDLAALLARAGPATLCQYPDASPLERLLAERFGVAPEQVLVTAGADDAIDRACRAFLTPSRELVLPTPTFEMIERYARLAGAPITRARWRDGPLPVDVTLDLLSPRTAMIAVVSPNNPTGAVASAGDLARLSAAAPDATLLVDLAYTEFAEVDLTACALTLPNAVVLRTFSKACGLAGMRVGYAIGPRALIATMRVRGAPFPVSRPALAAAGWIVEHGAPWLAGVVARVREERSRLARLLRGLGAAPQESQANFVLAAFLDADRVWRALADRGIAIRSFPGAAGIEDCLRITCPAREESFQRLEAALLEILQ